jgi:ATP-dependent DNA ligase
MLVRPDALPRGDYSCEVKSDGFRAIVSTEDGLRVWSRRGWDTTERLTELQGMPEALVLDGELIVLGDGRPSFPLLSQRVLHGWDLIGLSLAIFDVLRVGGEDAMCLPCAERRALCPKARAARCSGAS